MPTMGWDAVAYVTTWDRSLRLLNQRQSTRPSPGTLQNILYGVAAITDSDVWAVGAEQDSGGIWHTLTEHWNGSVWSVVKAVDAGSNGNQLYAVKALATNNVYAVGQQAGSAFPNLS